MVQVCKLKKIDEIEASKILDKNMKMPWYNKLASELITLHRSVFTMKYLNLGLIFYREDIGQGRN